MGKMPSVCSKGKTRTESDCPAAKGRYQEKTNPAGSCVPEKGLFLKRIGGEFLPSQDPRRISLQFGKPCFQFGSGTSAAEADFFSSLTAGLKACSTP
jgi:hypothetical protein